MATFAALGGRRSIMNVWSRNSGLRAALRVRVLVVKGPELATLQGSPRGPGRRFRPDPAQHCGCPRGGSDLRGLRSAIGGGCVKTRPSPGSHRIALHFRAQELNSARLERFESTRKAGSRIVSGVFAQARLGADNFPRETPPSRTRHRANAASLAPVRRGSLLQHRDSNSRDRVSFRGKRLKSPAERAGRRPRRHSTVTLLARLRGWSTSVPRIVAT